MNIIKKVILFIQNIFTKKDGEKKLPESTISEKEDKKLSAHESTFSEKEEQPSVVHEFNVRKDQSENFAVSLSVAPPSKAVKKKVETLTCVGDGLGIKRKISY